MTFSPLADREIDRFGEAEVEHLDRPVGRNLMFAG